MGRKCQYYSIAWFCLMFTEWKIINNTFPLDFFLNICTMFHVFSLFSYKRYISIFLHITSCSEVLFVCLSSVSLIHWPVNHHIICMMMQSSGICQECSDPKISFLNSEAKLTKAIGINSMPSRFFFSVCYVI